MFGSRLSNEDKNLSLDLVNCTVDISWTDMCYSRSLQRCSFRLSIHANNILVYSTNACEKNTSLAHYMLQYYPVLYSLVLYMGVAGSFLGIIDMGPTNT